MTKSVLITIAQSLITELGGSMMQLVPSSPTFRGAAQLTLPKAAPPLSEVWTWCPPISGGHSHLPGPLHAPCSTQRIALCPLPPRAQLTVDSW